MKSYIESFKTLSKPVKLIIVGTLAAVVLIIAYTWSKVSVDRGELQPVPLKQNAK